jgi:hypothetical protein
MVLEMNDRLKSLSEKVLVIRTERVCDNTDRDQLLSETPQILLQAPPVRTTEKGIAAHGVKQIGSRNLTLK